MPDEDDPLPDLVRRLRAGDPQAPDALYALFARRLTRIAEEHLSRRLAGRLDGDDVVQSAFRTFFRRNAAGEFVIDSSGQLWRLLVRITLLKAKARARHHTAGVRDVGAEAAAGGDPWLLEAVSREPSPLEAVMLIDQIEALLEGLPPFYGQVLELRLQGVGPGEIASRLGFSRQTIQRALTLLRERLARGLESA
jgi:RNA polymerase sigma-70 factor (ECF subfamily)